MEHIFSQGLKEGLETHNPQAKERLETQNNPQQALMLCQGSQCAFNFQLQLRVGCLLCRRECLLCKEVVVLKPLNVRLRRGCLQVEGGGKEGG